VWTSFEVCSAAVFLRFVQREPCAYYQPTYSGSYRPFLFFFFRAASEGALKGILGYTDEDVVSNDFVGDSR